MATKNTAVRTLPQRLPPRKISGEFTKKRRDLAGIDIDLTENLSDVVKNLMELSYLIYGPKKIGKTKLCAQFGHVFFLMFEKTAQHLRVLQRLMADRYDANGEIIATAWLVAEAYVKGLIEKPGNTEIICCDGLLAMYAKAFIQACREGGFAYPGLDNDKGRSWNIVKSTFYRLVDTIIDSNFGVLLNCHDTATIRENLDGSTSTFICPDLSKYADEFVRHKIDNVFYLHYRGRDRWLQIRGDEKVYAGCAADENFLTTNGEQIYMIPMGNSAEEGYANIIKAFNNQQTKTYKEVTEQDIIELNKPKGDTVVKRTKEKRR